MKVSLYSALLYLVTLNVAQLPGASSAADDEGFTTIFDGKSLDGWVGDPKLWSVEEGAITGQTSDESPIEYNTFLKWANGEVDDFELKLEYRIFNGNSGIQIRSFELEKPYAVGGYQADFEAGEQWSGTNYGEQFRGILAKRGEKTVIGEDGKPTVTGSLGQTEELQKVIRQGDWNDYHIIARGNHFVFKINGQVMSDVTDNDTDMRRRIGLIAFQLHKGPAMKVQFRNVRLKRLPIEDVQKVVFVAGTPSHPPRTHEHNAGSLLMADLLNTHYGDKIVAAVYKNGWPADTTAFDNADAMVMFADGGMRHPGFTKLKVIDALREKGIGIGALHYAVEMTPGESNDTLARAIGGAFEIDWSVNPHWDAEFKSFPDHPVANGLEPFTINDEWYFNMRFVDGMKGVTPILSAIPDASTVSRPDGDHSGNPDVRKKVAAGEPAVVGWVYERADGGRGMGFTGLHDHDNLAQNSFRTALLNGIAWISGVEIPDGGLVTPELTKEQLDANLDPKPARKPKPAAKTKAKAK